MASGVSPRLANSSLWLLLEPPNLSFTPTIAIGVGESHTIASATAPPNPPMTLCSSAVTMAPVSLAASPTAETSSGLTVCMSKTLVEIPSRASLSAASNAMPTITPLATIVTSEPSRRRFALPISKSHPSSYTTGALPLIKRRYAGPLASTTPSRALTASAASAGTTTPMPGSTRIRATSPMVWWEAPSALGDKPLWVPTILTFSPGLATELAICSHALHATNTANPQATGVFPEAASPAATPIMSCSLIPTSMNLLGNLSAK